MNFSCKHAVLIISAVILWQVISTLIISNESEHQLLANAPEYHMDIIKPDPSIEYRLEDIEIDSSIEYELHIVDPEPINKMGSFDGVSLDERFNKYRQDFLDNDEGNLIYKVSSAGEIAKFSNRCFISKQNSSALRQIVKGDKVENNDRVVAEKSCEIFIKFQDHVIGKVELATGFDLVFQIETSKN